MNRGRTISLSLPPFTHWVKRLILTYAGIYLLMAILGVVSPYAHEWVSVYLSLIPKLVVHGMLWQLVTYSFLHFQLLHFLFNALALWMFGSQIESDWGSKRFLEFYFFCTVAAALTTVAVSYVHLPGMSPETMTIGASGGIYGLLVWRERNHDVSAAFHGQGQVFYMGNRFSDAGGSDPGDRRGGQFCASWRIAVRIFVSEVLAAERPGVRRFGALL
jgi:hypothetical protein